MSGLDKLVDRIAGESREEIDAVLEEARNTAGAIKAESRKNAKEECERIERKAVQDVEVSEERARASADLRTKQILLAGKQELIRDTVAMARERLKNMPDIEYAGFIAGLLEKHVPSRDAVLRFGKKDLGTGRIPAGEIENFIKAAAGKGAKVTVSDQAAAIEDGFILDFGGIEENCTIDALIDQNAEVLQDKVRDILFA